jgi:adenosylmethionine-8-amino-7-oxononanoate aminotransferase
VWTEDGERYLDATASLWYANAGHGRVEIADAVHRQLLELDAFNVFGDYANRPALDLAARLADLAPVADARVFLTAGGGEGIETAAKLARQYWTVSGMPERNHLIGRENAFHGAHGFGTAVGGISPNQVGFGPLIGNTSRVPYDSVDALRAEIDRLGAARVAAFFVEPVIGAGGVLPPPATYLKEVATLCKEEDVLLIFDEVICAFGRLGSWFAAERFDIEPDMIVFAKGVTSGYQPVGGVIVSGRIAEPFWSSAGRPFRTGPTYAGHPACCAAALANIDILEREGLLNRSRQLERVLQEALDPLADHVLVSEVRAGLGLMAAIELDSVALNDGLSVAEVFAATREAGVLVRPLGSSLAVSPPLTVTEDELVLIAQAIGTGLDRILQSSTRRV